MFQALSNRYSTSAHDQRALKSYEDLDGPARINSSRGIERAPKRPKRDSILLDYGHDSCKPPERKHKRNPTADGNDYCSVAQYFALDFIAGFGLVSYELQELRLKSELEYVAEAAKDHKQQLHCQVKAARYRRFEAEYRRRSEARRSFCIKNTPQKEKPERYKVTQKNPGDWDRRKAINLADPVFTYDEGDFYGGPGPLHETADLLANMSFDRRNEKRNYSGQNRNFNRKRHRDEGNDHTNEYERPARRRYEEPIASRLRREIILIGEDPSRPITDIAAGFGRDIANNFEDDQVRGRLLDTIGGMLLEQPMKIPMVAAVILYANDLNPEVGKTFIQFACKELNDALEMNRWRDFKLLLRFFASVQNILAGDGVFHILNQLFDWVIELQSGSDRDALGLELVKIILLAVPYALVASPEAKDKVGDVLDKTEIVASEVSNHLLASLVNPYPINGEERPYGFQSIIELLQKQLREEANRDWQFSCIPRIYIRVEKNGTAEGENGTKEPVKHAIAPLTIPAPVDMATKPLFPETYFTMYGDADVATMPGLDNAALLIIRDVLVDTINIMDYNRLRVAEFLLSLDQFWSPGTFASRGISLDQLKNYPSDRSTWKPEDMMMDAIFSQMLVLPTAEHKLVYYHSIITEACKMAPGHIAPTLGRGIRWLFKHVDDMDMELMYRFLDWFAHHLSNFEFRWKWAEWVDELDKSDLSPRKAFIIAVIDKEIRLSFAKRVRETVPDVYNALIPPAKFKDTPDFKYASEDTPFALEGMKIYEIMKTKGTEDEIQPYIDSIEEQAAAQALEPGVASTDAYVTAMCFHGAKSVSHILSAINRAQDRLTKAGQSSDAVRRQIVQSVVSYWKDQPGNAVSIVDKLLNFTIVTPESVILWALGAESLGNGSVLAQAWRYEIVSITINKVRTRIRQIVAAKVQASVDGKVEGKELTPEELQGLDDTLEHERAAMLQLFSIIVDAVSGVASGSADGMLESDTSPEDLALIRAWGERWASTYRRKRDVEEACVKSEAVDAMVESAKVQAVLAAERKRKREEEEAIARAKEEEERQARIAKEEAEKAAAEAAKAAAEAEAKAEAEANGGMDVEAEAEANGDGEVGMDEAE